MKVSENLSILFIVEKSSKSKDGLAPIHVRITSMDNEMKFPSGLKSSRNCGTLKKEGLPVT